MSGFRPRHDSKLMEFTFDDDQEELRRAVRAFLDARVRRAYVRAMLDDDRGFTDAVWDQHRRARLAGAARARGARRLGLGLVDMVVVLEEMGRVPFPGPFFSSAVFATLAARASRARRSARHRWHPAPPEARSRSTRRATATRSTASARVPCARAAGGGSPGTKPVVLDGHTADWVLVVARTAGGARHVPGRGAGRRARAGVGRHPQGRAPRASTARPPSRSGPTATTPRLAADRRRRATSRCAPSWSARWSRPNSLAVEYAKVRVQFDRPIATFQVIKHKAADMLHRLELSRVGTHYAAWASDADDAGAEPRRRPWPRRTSPRRPTT